MLSRVERHDDVAAFLHVTRHNSAVVRVARCRRSSGNVMKMVSYAAGDIPQGALAVEVGAHRDKHVGVHVVQVPGG